MNKKLLVVHSTNTRKTDWDPLPHHHHAQESFLDSSIVDMFFMVDLSFMPNMEVDIGSEMNLGLTPKDYTTPETWYKRALFPQQLLRSVAP